MKVVKYILMVQLSCLCQAFQNSSTQTDPADVHVRAEANNTKLQEKFSSDPYVHHLGGKCSWTLRMPGNRSSNVVALTSHSADMLAEQICQDLGCGSVYDVTKTSSPPNTSCYHHCLYQDGRLQNCSQSVGNNCAVINATLCGHQAVQLAGGSDRCAGRVELWRDGEWGTVCDDQWDLRDANVVCAQLGCGYALNVTGQAGSFPPGRGPIHLDDLNCTGREENLWACPGTQDEPDCGHKEDAGVVCSEMKAVRLNGGLDRCSGKVEIHRNGSWGTVCDNCWNKAMASMVCSMLQCGAEPKNFSQFVPSLTHNTAGLYFYSCNPNVQSLWKCKELINHPHLCLTSKASGVICNGSLGLSAATTATTVTTDETAVRATVVAAAADGLLFPPPELLAAITLCLMLLVLLITNTVLCCHYRKRHAYLLQQTRTNTQPSFEHHQNNYKDAVDLAKVTANPSQTDAVSDPRYLWTQLSSVDSTSVDTDYEQYDPNNDPSACLSTFRNSQRYRTDVNSLMRPSGLDSLFEEGPHHSKEAIAAFTSCNSGPSDPQYSRVSKISVDSFDTSSTSSDECYENVNNSYVIVTPDPGLGQSSAATFDPSFYSRDQLSGEAPNLQSSDDDDGPLYSPVSPD
ncbi:T-cell differentiation antigen CD6-like [Embiotoca jacksoni]|uniref:T-cell differentiation antigen CD6-like n=1 Tax=Embiotoca jacksoni TaxID=100190 RepID=UPI00370467EA